MSGGTAPPDPVTEAAYQALIDEIRAEFPRFRLIRKSESLLHRSIHVALALLTLGGQRRYLRRYTTTIGARVYVPARWDRWKPRKRIAILRHERVHLRQFARFGLLPMALLYLLVPLPLGFAWFRMRFEREAYEESMRARWELRGGRQVVRRRYRRRMVRHFTGPDYGWMWLLQGQVERWFDSMVARLIAEHGPPEPEPAGIRDTGDGRR